MPAWPASLPPAPNYGWRRKRQTNVAAFQPDVGEAKYRRRSTATGVLCSGTFTMTQAQRDTLDEFFSMDLADGSLPFSWVDPVTNEMSRFCFQEPFEETAAGPDRFDIGVTVLRLP